jgi:hypothetical protein
MGAVGREVGACAGGWLVLAPASEVGCGRVCVNDEVEAVAVCVVCVEVAEPFAACALAGTSGSSRPGDACLTAAMSLCVAGAGWLAGPATRAGAAGAGVARELALMCAAAWSWGPGTGGVVVAAMPGAVRGAGAPALGSVEGRSVLAGVASGRPSACQGVIYLFDGWQKAVNLTVLKE